MNVKNRWIQVTIIGLFTLAIGMLIFFAQVDIKEFENTGSTSLESTTNDTSVSSSNKKEMESPVNDEISSFFPALGFLILIFIYSGIILFKNQKDRKVKEQLREIPEHAKMRDILMYEQGFLSRVIASTPFIICRLETNGIITFVNHTGEQITGYKEKELIGKNFWNIFYPGDEYLQVKELFRNFTGEEIRNYEMILTGRRSEKHAVLWNFIRQLDAHGNPFEIICFGNDITDRQLLPHISYEMRTLMKGIMKFSQMLLEDDLTNSQYDYVMNILNSSHTLLTLINNILDLPTIRTGRLNLEVMDFDMYKIIEDIGKTEGIKAHDKGLELATLIKSNVPAVLRGDSGRLCQVIRNLVHNAITCTTQGEVMISAELAHETDTRADIRIEITYPGEGISEKGEEIPTSTRLGVTIAKELIKLMGSEIHIESEEGKGSTVWFTVIFEKQLKFAEESPLDISEMLSRVDGNRKLIADLLDAFVIEYPPQLEELSTEINAGNFEKVDHCAHKLKGTINTLSANKASELAFKLEKMGKEKNLDTAHEVFMRLEDELQKINVWKNSYK